MEAEPGIRLEASGLQKRFGAVVALHDGRLRFGKGEILALLGANGCGKSTLSKILAGTVRLDAGTIRVDGQDVAIRRPRDAEALGIGLFYQELSLIPQLTVEENLFLGHEPARTGMVDRRRRRQTAEALIARFGSVAGAGLTPTATVARLSPDQQQIVEILKVLARRPRIAIMDEPTASLDRNQVEAFFAILRQLKADGVSTILISHRMNEVFAIADRITVMRNGATVADLVTAETDRDTVVRLMVGETYQRAGEREKPPVGTWTVPPVLEAANLAGPRTHDVSLAVRPGEILGLGGLQGQGQSRLLRGLFAAEPFSGGTIRLGGRPVALRSPREAVRQGLAYVSGDRGRDAALHGRSIFENVASAAIVSEGRTIVSPARLKPRLLPFAQSLNTKFASFDAAIGTLSGGNQQKVFIARWLATAPKVLLLDDPTKGIDLAAKADLYRLIRDLADRGCAILFYSSEDSELVENCDRILVFHDGAVAAELQGETLDALHLYRAAYGEAAA